MRLARALSLVSVLTPAALLSASSHAAITCGKPRSVESARGGPPPSLGPPEIGSSMSEVEASTKGLPPETIQRVVRDGFPAMRLCYEEALRPCPDLSGRVNVSFIIGSCGTVISAKVVESSLQSAKADACVVKAFRALEFPTFEGPPIKVQYPVRFTPGG